MKNESHASGSSRGGPQPAVRDPQLHPVDWAAQEGAIPDVLHKVDLRLRRRRSRRLRAAAGGAVALLVAGFVWHSAFQRKATMGSLRPASAVVSLPAHEVLSDGSVVELKDGAEITVDYTAESRRVTLQHGEAHFQVAKDPQRPFVVRASGVEVYAVGTVFSIQCGQTLVEVLVTEGRVAVERFSAAPAPARTPHVGDPQPPARPLAFVDAGNRVVVDAAGIAAQSTAPLVQTVSKKELRERLAWRVPRLEFSGTPLTEVISLVNKYSDVRLILVDPELGGVPLSGILRADNIGTLLRLLEEEHGIKSEQRGGTDIVLSKAR